MGRERREGSELIATQLLLLGGQHVEGVQLAGSGNEGARGRAIDAQQEGAGLRHRGARNEEYGIGQRSRYLLNCGKVWGDLRLGPSRNAESAEDLE